MNRDDHSLGYARRALVASSVTAFVVILVLAVGYAADVLLLAFAGILLAIFLRGLVEVTSDCTRLPAGWSLLIVLVALVAVFGVGGWLLAGQIVWQVEQISEALPRSLENLRQQANNYPGAKFLLDRAPTFDQWTAN